MTMKLTVYNRRGEETDTIEVDDAVFGLAPNGPVVHQTLLAQLANRRAGTAETKTRGQVSGSTAKIRRQKGTGRARQGSIRAAHQRGGGVVFGPHVRSYAQRLPRRMRRLAIRSVLSAKAEDGSLKVVDSLAMETPKTREMADALRALGIDRPVLIVTGTPDEAVKRSVGNLPDARLMPASHLNVVDMLGRRYLLMTVEAVRAAESLWGGERANSRRPAPAAEAG